MAEKHLLVSCVQVPLWDFLEVLSWVTGIPLLMLQFTGWELLRHSCIVHLNHAWTTIDGPSLLTPPLEENMKVHPAELCQLMDVPLNNVCPCGK